LSGTIPSTSPPVTWWAVWKGDDLNGSRFWDVTSRMFVTHNAANYDMYNGAGPVTGGTSDTSKHYFVAIFNGASSLLRRDGVQIISGNAGSTATGTGLWFGVDSNATSVPCLGRFYEMGATAQALSGANLTALETYLAGL
jgi:hypothetical protein